MAITHVTAARNALCSAINTLINAGTTNTTGKIQIRNSSNTVLSTLLLANPAFGTPSTGTMTANAISADNNAANTGTAANYAILDRDNTIILTGTVSAAGGGGDLIINRTSINAGDTVSATSMGYTASP